MSDKLKKYQMILNTLDSLGHHVFNTFEMQQKVKDTMALNDYNNWVDTENKKLQTDLAIKEKRNTELLEDSETRLKQSMDYLEAHDVTRDLYANKVTEKYRTKEWEDIFKEHGLTLNDDLTFYMDDVSSLADKQLQFTQASKVINDINSSLNLMETGIMSLNDHLTNVSTDYGQVGVLDYEDFDAYVNDPDNAHIFKQPLYVMDKDDPTVFALDKNMQRIAQTDKDGNVILSDKNNYLGRAFLSPERWTVDGKVGFAPQYSGTAPAEVIPKLNINSSFEMIQEVVANINSKAIGSSAFKIEYANKDDKEFLDKYKIAKFTNLKSGQKLYDDPTSAAMLRNELEQVILSIVDGSTSESMASLEGLFKGSDMPFIGGEQDKINFIKEFRESIGFKEIIGEDGEPTGENNYAIYNDKNLQNLGVQAIFDKFIGVAKSYVGADGNTYNYFAESKDSETNMPRIGNGSEFSKFYQDLGLDLNEKTEDKDIGTSLSDQYLYHILIMWSRINNQYPGSVLSSLDNLNE
ncbi:MAG: hypothetical protein Unbinned3338contig1000_56 [Prokaryotic dsDNA virus sp.]|nr:MAG: hypothetical protein Unbinned3338contig1000_56 [Prokaryotic dsDNA virus sp.]